MSTATIAGPLPYFRFNRNYQDTEQVRHLMPAYRERRAQLDAAHKYPYDASFTGYLVTSDSDENMAVYLCQRLYALDREAEKEAEAIAAGYQIVDRDNLPTGYVDIIRRARYMGGTGWQPILKVRLTKIGPYLYALPPRKRTNGYMLSDGYVLWRSAE